jgi:lysophospholipase L1-like esterase
LGSYEDPGGHWLAARALRGKDPLLRYIDAEQALLGTDGRPRPEHYAENGLNFNERGYQVWTGALRPAIEEEWTRKR